MDGWPLDEPGFVAAWRAAYAVLAGWRVGATARFAVASGATEAAFGEGAEEGAAPAFALRAPPEIWARFQMMRGIGHFPLAENPPLFAEYLLPILDEIRTTRE